MDLVQIFETVKMVGIILSALLALGVTIAYIVGGNELNDKVVLPWEKEERRVAKKREKEERRKRREFWNN